MTVLAFERFPVDGDETSAFETALDGRLESMRLAPGALWADAARAVDDAPSYVVLSEWRTGGDLEAWEGSEVEVAFAETTDPFLRGEVTRRRFASG